jgi:uncharacterized membrane protein YdjX (TVP38/TMEM64 family)
MTDPVSPARKPFRLLSLWPLALIAVLLGTAFALGLHKYLTLEQLRASRESLLAFVAAKPLLAHGAFIGVYMLATLSMVPGALWITIAGGLMFGLVGGTLATIAGATMGATSLFLLARTTLGAGLRERAGPFLKRLEAGFQDSPLSYMFALRFLPVVPFPVANIAPALFGAKLWQYVLATSLGIVPGVLAYTWLGSGLADTFASGGTPDLGSIARNLVPALLALGAVSLIPVVYKAVTRRKPTATGAVS